MVFCNRYQAVRGIWRHALASLTLLALSALGGEPNAQPNAQAAADSGDKIEYNRDIRPILSTNCFSCHGPDSASRKADLRLDQRDAAIAMSSIVPGKPGDSEMIRRIETKEAEELMPPAASHKKLTAAEKKLLRDWVAAGAEYQPHWSFIAPQRPQPPAVKNEKWVRNPIDRFILARLEKLGLQPAPEADRPTLARRLALDLTGLPPTPEDAASFLNDKSPDAYEKYIDRLMASPHWGEHRGRYWLDAARYADTHGIHFDNFREAWAYRDWVIGAYNQKIPFDQFTVEQLAGDLLPNRTLEQQIASGFNRCNITTNEGGIIDEEYLVLYTRDRTETTSQVWMGLTAGCAVCHDHKFDPLSQKEFYAMAAFFNNTTQVAKDGNIKDTPPIVVVPAPADRKKWDESVKQHADVLAKSQARRQQARGEYHKWEETGTAEKAVAVLSTEARKLHLSPHGFIPEQAIKIQPGVSIEIAEAGDFERNQPFSVGAWVKIPSKEMNGSIVARMDESKGHRGWDLWVEQGRLAVHLINDWPNNALKASTNKPVIPANKWTHVFATFDGKGKGAGVKLYVNGKLQEFRANNNNLSQTVRTEVPLKVGQRSTGSRLEGAMVHDLRIYGRTLPEHEVEQIRATTKVAEILAGKPKEKRSAQDTDLVYDWWLNSIDKEFGSIKQQQQLVEKDQAEIKARGTIAHVMNERTEGAMAHILHRGEYDQRRDPVQPATPAVLPPLPSELPKNRLGFANWLLRPEHPLTARVTVNRYWQEVFGNGLVRTAGDFGVSGEQPTNPELLDWLAVEFRESGWDVPKFYKLLLTSAAYRQAAIATQPKIDKDAQNVFVSRGPRFRMDAEMIRDYALAASGLLVRKIGGPSVKPYQPEGVWEAVAMRGSNTRDYKADTGENLYRRSMYTLWKRSAPPASMDVFNAPNRETCVVRRERTNTPLQALVTMNDPQFVEANRHLAQSAMKNGGATFETQVDYIAQRVLIRSLRPEELKVVQGSFDELSKYYAAHLEDAKLLIAVGESKADPAIEPAKLASWTMLVNELMNLDEVLNK